MKVRQKRKKSKNDKKKRTGRKKEWKTSDIMMEERIRMKDLN